jgi:5'-nucleotidase
MGTRSILENCPPDLVLSGVNSGQNIAEDVIYSGTIAGAMEGTILGIPSIALSQTYGHESGRDGIYWDCAETHAPDIIKKILAEGIPKDIVINVNFPDCPAVDVKGVSVTVQGRRDARTLKIDSRKDGRSIPYYWIAYGKAHMVPGAGTDLEAVAQKHISITPLRFDLTDEPTVTRYALALK